jgi:hypothetical protein
MPKKSKFKYKVGQAVKFRFYDGSVHSGVIVKSNYRNEEDENLPTQWTMTMYTMHTPDNSGRYPRGYMVYPSITENMVKSVLSTEVKIIPMKDYVKPEKPVVIQTVLQETDDLEDAFTKQKQFIDGKVKQ